MHTSVFHWIETRGSSKGFSGRGLNSVHWGINPHLKTFTLIFFAMPPLNLQTVQTPLLRQFPPYIGGGPRVFIKLLRISISLMRKPNIREIIYLDMLILSCIIREAHISRGTDICLLQNLGFIINIKKSILHPCQKIEFMGMEINLIKMTLSLTPVKV